MQAIDALQDVPADNDDPKLADPPETGWTEGANGQLPLIVLIIIFAVVQLVVDQLTLTASPGHLVIAACDILNVNEKRIKKNKGEAIYFIRKSVTCKSVRKVMCSAWEVDNRL